MREWHDFALSLPSMGFRDGAGSENETGGCLVKCDKLNCKPEPDRALAEGNSHGALALIVLMGVCNSASDGNGKVKDKRRAAASHL
jgi:hypothetical protein